MWWDLKITSIILNTFAKIWSDRNTCVHGKNIEKAKAKA
jgi:hypothetical protein